ncbi:MAG: hypothetical protein HYY13_12145 [Nitrospirae bacterium]|nr:hypothetical protein [Nitrospirota bacterium]
MNNGRGSNGKVIERLDRLERTMGKAVQAIVALNHREGENHRALRQELAGLRQEFHGLRGEFRTVIGRLDKLIEATVRGRTQDADKFKEIDRKLALLDRIIDGRSR